MPNCILIPLLKPLLCRDDQIRTGDPFVPNEVRYQLRYIPNSSFLATAKVQFFSFSDHNLIEIFHIMDKYYEKSHPQTPFGSSADGVRYSIAIVCCFFNRVCPAFL